jgi:hypothetical protein
MLRIAMEVGVKRRVILWAGLAGVLLTGQVGFAQQPQQPKTAAKSKSSAKAAMAQWTPEVQQTLGVSASAFAAAGLNKLTKAQLAAVLTAAKPDPAKSLLTCSAGDASSGKVRVLLKVAGEDASPDVVGQIQQKIAGLAGVELVDAPAAADIALHVVIQEQTMGKRTIGFTASYVTGTPCVQEKGDKKTDVELKRQLGVYTNPKSVGVAQDLATMFDQELQTLRGTSAQ